MPEKYEDRTYTLKQDLAATKLVLSTACLCMKITVLLPKLWMLLFGGSAVNQSDMEVGLDTTGALKFSVETRLAGFRRCESSIQSFINTTFW